MQISNSNIRLKELLDYFGDTQADMVRKTGIEKSAISNYIKGKREARQDKLILIANAYKVNPAWLMGLDVPMNLTPSVEYRINDVSIEAEKDEATKRAEYLYDLYKSAPPEVQAAVEAILKSAKQDSGSHNQLP